MKNWVAKKLLKNMGVWDVFDCLTDEQRQFIAAVIYPPDIICPGGSTVVARCIKQHKKCCPSWEW